MGKATSCTAWHVKLHCTLSDRQPANRLALQLRARVWHKPSQLTIQLQYWYIDGVQDMLRTFTARAPPHIACNAARHVPLANVTGTMVTEWRGPGCNTLLQTLTQHSGHSLPTGQGNIHRHIAYYTPSIMHHNFILLKLMSSTLFELALQSMLLSQPVLWHVVCSAALPVRHTGKHPSQLSAPACASLGPDTCSCRKSERSLVRASIDAAQ